MATEITGKQTLFEKALLGATLLVIFAAFGLIVYSTYPTEEKKAQFMSDCEKRGGVLLTHNKLLGVSHTCASRLD